MGLYKYLKDGDVDEAKSVIDEYDNIDKICETVATCQDLIVIRTLLQCDVPTLPVFSALLNCKNESTFTTLFDEIELPMIEVYDLFNYACSMGCTDCVEKMVTKIEEVGILMNAADAALDCIDISAGRLCMYIIIRHIASNL